MGKPNLLIGKRFGRLLVLKRVENNKHKKIRYLCVCDCGNNTKSLASDLVKGYSTSCGCYRIEQNLKAHITHGLSKHPLYKIWIGIKERCYNHKYKCYHNYGGRGISMCKEWIGDFVLFYNWCIENGWKRRMEIDRFPNNDGNYEPSNCRIATSKQNCNNRRGNVYATIDGVTKTPSEWADITGIKQASIRNRISEGFTGKRAVYGARLLNKTT